MPEEPCFFEEPDPCFPDEEDLCFPEEDEELSPCDFLWCDFASAEFAQRHSINAAKAA